MNVTKQAVRVYAALDGLKQQSDDDVTNTSGLIEIVGNPNSDES